MIKKEIHKQFSQILWLRAELDPGRGSNLTQICIYIQTYRHTDRQTDRYIYTIPYWY